MPTRLSQEEADIQTGTTAAITVNASADWVALLWSHYDGNSGTSLASASIDGANFALSSQRGEGQDQDAAGVGVGFLDAPSTGAQTLTIAWSGGGDRDDGGQFLLVYGEDTGGGTSVRAAISAQSSSTALSETLSTETPDLVLGVAAAYSLAAAVINTANSTLISSDPIEDDVASLLMRGYDITPLATSTDIDQNTQSFGGVAAISLQEEAASGTAVPVFTHHLRTIKQR